MLVTTLHSIDRLKERCNIKNYKAAERDISLAIQRGKHAEQYAPWERTYLSAEAYDNCTAIAYNNFCYIINEFGMCVTVYNLPAWFGQKKHFAGKERICDYKKYCKANRFYRDEYEWNRYDVQ